MLRRCRECERREQLRERARRCHPESGDTRRVGGRATLHFQESSGLVVTSYFFFASGAGSPLSTFTSATVPPLQHRAAASTWPRTSIGRSFTILLRSATSFFLSLTAAISVCLHDEDER